MRSIKFSCDQNWGAMIPLDDDTRFCTACNTCVKDYSQLNSKEPSLNSGCGRFNLSQIDHYQGVLKISKPNLLQLSLIAFLGLATSTISVAKQPMANEDKCISLNLKEGHIKVEGVIKDSLSNAAITDAFIEVFDSKNIVAISYPDSSGRFSFEIDSARYPLEELQLVVKQYHQHSDTIAVKPYSFNEIEVSMDVFTDGFSDHELLTVTGPSHNTFAFRKLPYIENTLND